MYFAHTALAVAYFVVCVNGQAPSDVAIDENVEENDEPTDAALIDNHTFVTLIDIVFTDGTKRTCTGSIIHENVIITAAHCFKGDNDPEAKPELTASFAVIGTKTMFDTGYEQYLPIERVLTHPKYRGWTADLSLVYTFAGMISDKPGSIIPLAGEKTSTHVDSNVTVLSWGHLMHNMDAMSSIEKTQPVTQHGHDEEEPCFSEEEEHYESKGGYVEDRKRRVTASLHKQLRIRQRLTDDQSYIYSRERELNRLLKAHQKNQKHRSVRFKESSSKHSIREDIENLRSKLNEKQTSSNIKRYHSDVERSEVVPGFNIFGNSNNRTKKEQARRHRKTGKSQKKTIKTTKRKLSRPKTTTQSSVEQFLNAEDKEAENQKEPLDSSQIFGFKSYYNNWRRQMGTQQNQLTVENFGFVNIQACKLLIEKAMPKEYDISKSNDVVCYASGDRFINDDDSGAPAIRHGALVAVTVGGAECDGDHVAVGMKMSCYCSWIADNLPSGGSDLNCCKNCCDVTHKDETNKEKSHNFKNTFL